MSPRGCGWPPLAQGDTRRSLLASSPQHGTQRAAPLCGSYPHSPGRSRAGCRELWLVLRGLAGLALRPGSEPRSPCLRRGAAVPLQGGRSAKDPGTVHIPNTHFIHLALKKNKTRLLEEDPGTPGDPPDHLCGRQEASSSLVSRAPTPLSYLGGWLAALGGDFSGGDIPSDAEGPRLPPPASPAGTRGHVPLPQLPQANGAEGHQERVQSVGDVTACGSREVSVGFPAPPEPCAWELGRDPPACLSLRSSSVKWDIRASARLALRTRGVRFPDYQATVMTHSLGGEARQTSEVKEEQTDGNQEGQDIALTHEETGPERGTDSGTRRRDQ